MRERDRQEGVEGDRDPDSVHHACHHARRMGSRAFCSAARRRSAVAGSSVSAREVNDVLSIELLLAELEDASMLG